MDLERQVRVRAKDLIRSSLEKWTLKGSVCVWACVSPCSCLSGCAKHEVTDREMTPTVLQASKSHKNIKKKPTPARARSTYDNRLDESLEAALTFKTKKKHTCIHHWGRKEESFCSSHKEIPSGSRRRKSFQRTAFQSCTDSASRLIMERSGDGCYLQDTWRYICEHFPAVHNLKNISSLIYLSTADLFLLDWFDRRQHKIL